MPDPFMVEKIRTGEQDPFEVVRGRHDGTVTVTNFDDGTVSTIGLDNSVTVELLDARH